MATKQKVAPVFYGRQFHLEVGSERAERILSEPDRVEVLTWNVFASLDTHRDPDWLGYRLQAFGGAAVRAPARLSLWTGRDREPRLLPNPGYAKAVQAKASSAGGKDGSVEAFVAPVEVPVRIETPAVLVLVDTVLGGYPQGNGGRDRILELVDAGLDQARRLGKTLAVAMVYPSGTTVAGEVSARMNWLRDPAVLAKELPHRSAVPEVALREVTWQQLIATWDAERSYLDLAGQPVRPFLEHCRRLGLR